MLTYALACALLIWGAESYRKLATRLQDEEILRKIAVEELAHRPKNQIATIQSIISQQLRDLPERRDDIVGRLVALSATDGLIMASQGQGARIGDILFTELRAYDLSRISMKGPDTFFGPKLATTMALLVHELTTNAAKHGALSCAAGTSIRDWAATAYGEMAGRRARRSAFRPNALGRYRTKQSMEQARGGVDVDLSNGL